MLSLHERIIKRVFDITLSFILIILFFPIILGSWLLATLDTGMNGFFTQQRVGLNGVSFNIIKIRTMRFVSNYTTTVTTKNDPRITRIGSFLRKTKIDELPQLINVFLGDMSFVGPRPDVESAYRGLATDDLVILKVRPGITCPATLVFRDEESILALKDDPEAYNRHFIFPEKVRMNRAYVENWSLARDFSCIFATVLSIIRK